MTTALIALVSVCAQIEYAEPEPDALPTVFELQDGTKIAGYAKDGWQREENVSVERDAPWLPKRERTTIISVRQVKSSWQERPGEWRDRHETAWRERDYVNLGEGDTYYYIPRDEIALAERATELAAEPVEAVAAVSPSTPPPSNAQDASANESNPGFLRLWGPHLAIGAVTLLLAAGIVWGMLVRPA